MKKPTIKLQTCSKTYTYDQDKACTPEETVDRFHSLLKGADLDILKEIRRIDNGRLDIPVYFSVCGEDALKTIGNKKQMGKGSTPAQSRASACMELGERFSFFAFIKNEDNFLVGDYEAMVAAGHPVLDVDILLQSVHDETMSRDMLLELLQGIPMQWTWSTRISDGAAVLIPFSWFYAINEFNGPSAGNTYEEAVLQGISEIIERHVCALVTKDSLVTPAIDPDTVTDPVAVELLDKFKKNGIELFLNDFSLDTGIATVGALAWDPSTFPDKSEIVYTAGTTPDPTKALIRALTEIAQLAGDFNSGSNYVASGLPKPLALDEVNHIVQPKQYLPLQNLPDLGDDDMYIEIRNCLAALQQNDMDVYIIDTMHPKLQIPTIYTIIPGAHFRERAAGGNAGLFSAKLAADLLDSELFSLKVEHMQQLLPEAYYLEFYRGRNLYEKGEVAAALPNFDAALAHNPNSEDLPYIYSYKGCCLRDMERYTEAVEILEKGLACDETRPDIHNILGVCHFKTEAYERAVYHFTRAVELNPVSAIDYANLALNQEKIGDTEAAAQNYQIALSQDPGIEFAAERLSLLLQQQQTPGGER